MRKGQASLEFMMLIAFMMLVFVGFFALANTQLALSRQQQTQEEAADIAARLVEQVELAASMQDGFGRTFIMPQTVDGSTYSIVIIDDWEVVVEYQGYEHVEFLSTNVSGPVQTGVNSLRKQDERLYLNT